MRYPPLVHAQVMAHDPPFGVRVQLSNGMQLGQTVRVLQQGAADARRVNQMPLPGLGTWGLIAMPYGNPLNAVWMGSYYSQNQAAYTSDATDPFVEYRSHFSGEYELLTGDGEWCRSFPDGTFLIASGSAVKPVTYRYDVDATQTQNRVEFPDSERNPNPPSPRYLYLSHASGTTVEIDPAGNTTVHGATGSVLTLTFGGTVLTINGSGNVDINAANANLTIESKNVTLDSSGNLSAIGEVTAKAGTAASVGLTSHITPTAPSGPTSPPQPGT